MAPAPAAQIWGGRVREGHSVHRAQPQTSPAPPKVAPGDPATHRHHLPSLQGELRREAVGQQGVISILALDLPIAHGLVLPGRKGRGRWGRRARAPRPILLRHLGWAPPGRRARYRACWGLAARPGSRSQWSDAWPWSGSGRGSPRSQGHPLLLQLLPPRAQPQPQPEPGLQAHLAGLVAQPHELAVLVHLLHGHAAAGAGVLGEAAAAALGRLQLALLGDTAGPLCLGGVGGGAAPAAL